eukprot:786124-Alexandrium_andersonii.AAC.1
MQNGIEATQTNLFQRLFVIFERGGAGWLKVLRIQDRIGAAFLWWPCAHYSFSRQLEATIKEGPGDTAV